MKDLNLDRANGFVYGYPTDLSGTFHLEFAEFYTLENKEPKDKFLNDLHLKLSQDNPNVQIFSGDIDEIFEFFLETEKLNQTLSDLNLTLLYGLRLYFEPGEEGGGMWGDEIQDYLNYVKEKYIICDQTFLSENKIDKMYEDYENGLEEIYNKNLDFEKEAQEIHNLKVACEERYS